MTRANQTVRGPVPPGESELTSRRDDAECIGTALGGARHPHTRTTEVVEISRWISQRYPSARRPEVDRISLVLEHSVQSRLPIGRKNREVAHPQLTTGGGVAAHGHFQSRYPAKGG